MHLFVKSTPLSAINAVAFDTETTSLDAAEARVVQFGAVTVMDGAISGEPFNTLVNPGKTIPVTSAAIHGVRDADVAQSPRFAQAFDSFLRYCGDRPWVGHSTDYDAAVLSAECQRHGVAWRRPLFLDARILARIAAPGLVNYSLEFLCEWLEVDGGRRHDALSDARAAGEVFIRLIPRLREKGVRTVGEAVAASDAAQERLQQLGPQRSKSSIKVSTEAAADTPLARLDYYPYARRVREVMTSPPLFASAETTLPEAANLMLGKGVSAVLVASDGRMGIVTERDILRAFAANALAAQTCRVDETMSSPLSTVDADDFLYRALGRIDRLGIRHLPVVSQGQIVGMVTPRNLLKRPLTQAFDLGDEIASANTVSSLARAKAKITPLSSALLKEGLDAADVGAVIAEELCALTARAAVIAEQKLLSEGKGSPPAPYALLVLGSVGRGESLLSADQDNALIYREGGGNDAEWFALFGKHISDALDEAGVPYCNGGVMVKNAAWRHTEAGWRDLVESWLRRSNPQDLLNVDIFFDATVAHGDRELGRSIRAYAYERAGAMPLFLKLLAETSRTWAPPLSMFGQLRADEKGRVDLKKGGLFPLCAAVRTLAIKHGVEARSTAERLDGLRRFNLISNDETDMALIARRTFMSYILTQQIADMNNGIQPSSRIELARLSRSDRAEVVRAMKACEPLIVATREGLL